MRISDWSSDVCSSDLLLLARPGKRGADSRRLQDHLREAGRLKRGRRSQTADVVAPASFTEFRFCSSIAAGESGHACRPRSGRNALDLALLPRLDPQVDLALAILALQDAHRHRHATDHPAHGFIVAAPVRN